MSGLRWPKIFHQAHYRRFSSGLNFGADTFLSLRQQYFRWYARIAQQAGDVRR